LTLLSGCALDKVTSNDPILPYQTAAVEKGPQQRIGDESIESLIPASEPGLPPLEMTGDVTGGRAIVNLTLDDAIVRTLANSPEIRVVSYDPSIARMDITRAISDFDVNFFGKLEYEEQDNPTDSLFQGGQSESRLLETGFRQKISTGAEWTLTYALSRNWDDLITRSIPTKFEPVLLFQIKQPLFRDAWPMVNLAGVNISKMNYKVALAAFRKKTGDISTDVISLYWTLLQSRRDFEIQEGLLEKTVETFRRLEDRRSIDATALQIKQAESSLKSRMAMLLEVRKRLEDVQDALVRLLSDNQINLLNDVEIIPATAPDTKAAELDQTEIIRLALANHPEVQQARMGVEIAEINLRFAKRQKMPRLDLVAVTRAQGLAASSGEAHEILSDRDYTSYTVGVSFEYPFGNHQRSAEFSQRKLEHSKSVSSLQNVSDMVAAEVKERIRLAGTAYTGIQIQKDAVAAAEIHLQALEDLEVIREKLTPEFLLVKLQAQEALSNARRAEIKAVVDYNIALTRLAQSTGTVLDMRYVQPPLQSP